MDAFIGLQIEGYINDSHDFVVQFKGNFCIKGFNDCPNFAYIFDFEAPQNVVNDQFS